MNRMRVRLRSRLQIAGGQRGFTLLEVLVAVTIVAVTFTTVFRLYGSTLRGIENGERYARAALLAESKLAQMQSATPFPPAADEGTFEANPDYRFKTGIEEYAAPIGRLERSALRDATERIATYHLSARVTWQDGGTEKEVTLRTLKTVVEESK